MAYFTDAQLGLLSKNTVQFSLLAKLEFRNGTKYVWDGEYPLTIDGNTYAPLHGVATIEGLGRKYPAR